MTRKYTFLGLFVLISVGALIWLAVNIGAIGNAKGKRYHVRLQHAAGLVKDNAVKIAGVKVGSVSRVGVEHKTAVLELTLDPEIALHEDAVAIVRAKSLLGEKYLQLDPGSADAPLVADGGQIQRVRTVFEIDEMLNALEPLLGGEGSLGAMVRPLLERTDRLMASATGDDGTDPVVSKAEIEQSIEDLRVSLATTRRMLEDNEATVKSSLARADALLADPRLDRTLRNVDRIAATTAERLPRLLDKTDRALDALDRVSSELTPERMEKVGRILDDAELATHNLRTLSEELVGVASELSPVLSNLRILLERAAAIDEKAFRDFTQKEGIRVNLGVPKNAKKRLKALEGR